MVAEHEKPIGAPVLTPTWRDRLSVSVAAHGWAIPAMRVFAGLALVALTAVAFGIGPHPVQIVSFVIGAVLGGEAGERVKERGARLLDALLSIADVPAPPDGLPAEFAEHFPQRTDPRGDPRFLRGR